MARINASLESVTEIGSLVKDIYIAHVKACNVVKSKSGNPMLDLTWEIESGDTSANEFAKRELKWDYVMLGGTTQKGTPMPLYRLANLIEACEVEWSCGKCDPNAMRESARAIPRKKVDNSTKLVCPDCDQVLDISFDSSSLIGKRCRLAVDVEKQADSDRERNVIKDYAPLA